MNTAPDIRRVRHELKRRQLTVTKIDRLGPAMLRVVLQGAELEGFTSLGFDDHIKVFFPSAEGQGLPAAPPAGDAPGSAAMRDFTPRHFDASNNELWIDFFVHEAGPAATWAAQAAAGQKLVIGGPKGSAIIGTAGIDLHLLAGDETALPAIGRRLEELPSSARTLVVVETADGQPCYPLTVQSATQLVWVARAADSQGPAPGSRLIDELGRFQIPAGRCFAWAALESQGARALRRYLVDDRHVDKHWIKAAGYWQRNTASVHDVIRDED